MDSQEGGGPQWVPWGRADPGWSHRSIGTRGGALRGMGTTVEPVKSDGSQSSGNPSEKEEGTCGQVGAVLQFSKSGAMV